ncbi:hypothetical protein Arnit_2415 [Arcobacter nitrofigilis DSM 7299]|uniref:Uncharacterized protein n=1 Tax=Arcobacter nitrofigilis (strain ATCC 33309 / DSM 7299 / CCUG 15893 / LMG 7604 / NCTC 12251 / CI) TaxID=572480 RepID=D5V1A4_ARCNC|nr:hypothetical protein [Arcobacter nitrofigilis]ADG94066.1 hypothetical protein Arnit_2415 [Arcobacter nitrofigilis DSM 7299]
MDYLNGKNIINLDCIYTNLFKVSEKILDKNLAKFIFHNLEEKATFQKNHKTFYTYLKYSKEYFVCSYENKKSAILIIDLISEYIKLKKLDKKRVLVYYDTYFLLFENSSLYYFQKIEKELLNQDMEVYIKKRFLFDYEEEIDIQIADLEHFKGKDKISSSLAYIYDSNKLKIYYYYLFTLLIISLSLIVFDYYKKESTKEELLRIDNKSKNKILIPKRQSLYFKISTLFANLEKHNLKISKFDFSGNSLFVTLIAKNRDDFYAFIQNYRNKKINSISKTKDGYEISASFVF